MMRPIFATYKIVPDVIAKEPGTFLEVKYSQSGKTVNLGNEIAPVDVKDAPKVIYHANFNDYYTIIFTDPDATNTEFRHWLVGNIPGNDVDNGDIINAYIGPGPPKGTGLHRYVFLLYKQSEKLEFDEEKLSNKQIGDRMKSSNKKFVEKYKLELIAGNFYQAQFDDYVLMMAKKFSRAC